MNEVHGQLKSNSPHVRSLKCRREVEVKVQQLVHPTVFLDLSTLHVTQQLQEPFERFLEK